MNNNFKPVATKISEASDKRLEHIAKKLGMTKYDMLQGFIDVLLRYTDDRHNLTPEMERLMTTFEHLNGWKDAFNLCDATVQPEVKQAVYFLADEEGKKHGIRVIMVGQPFFGNWYETENLQDILEQTMSYISPELYRKLRAIAVDLGTTSVMDTLLTLADEKVKEQDEAELRKPFEDCDRGDFGQKPDRTKYKRKMHKDIDSMEGLDSLDFRPIGGEW